VGGGRGGWGRRGGGGGRWRARLRDGDLGLDAAFYAGSEGRFIVGAASRAMPELETLARKHDVEVQLLGLAGGAAVEFEGQVHAPLDGLRAAWEGALL